MITFDGMIRQAVLFLEHSHRCPKHHVYHTGSIAYLLDLYSYLGEWHKGKTLVFELLNKIVRDGEAQVFYPGRIDPMNMSNNVIDTGTAVDAIARFAQAHKQAFTREEHVRIRKALGGVVDSYLREAARSKPITNQRLWGLTGLVSYGKYAGTDERTVVEESIARAFSDMTPDGFFRYYPHASRYGAPDSYDDITTFYQSRHTAFIRYALSISGAPEGAHEPKLVQSERALLSMYTEEGIKDLRLECKRWYWLSSYEVASHSFDAYALAHSNVPEADVALHNVLYQIRHHFFGGFLRSHIGADFDFQCPIFWTAHLAWLTRISGIAKRFDSAFAPVPFSFRLEGSEVFTDTTPARRILVNARYGSRNPTTGIVENGLPHHAVWNMRIPNMPQAYLFSARENANHAWYALRGSHVREACVRAIRFAYETFLMLLPRFSTGYGRVSSYTREGSALTVSVIPATKYGTLLPERETSLTISL